MPTLQVVTKESKSIWRSPDGQREIFEVGLDYNGTMLKAKTFSNDISAVGWEGEVESYERDGKFGAETYVKQPPKEGGFTPRQAGPHQSSTGGGGSKPVFDTYTMFLSYAKDIAVALIAKEGTINPDNYKAALSLVQAGGQELYEGRPGAEPAEQPKTIEAKDVPVDLAEIDKMFGSSEEAAWPKS